MRKGIEEVRGGEMNLKVSNRKEANEEEKERRNRNGLRVKDRE